MKRQPGRLATILLGALCALLAVLATLQSFGIGAGYSLSQESPTALEADLTQPMQQLEFRLPPEAQYIEISQRPLFTNDRKPRPIDPNEGTAVATEGPPPVPLNATLLGVLLDPEHRVAILRDNATSAVIRVRQGMPLPGELAGWTLQELEARKAIFDGGAQQGTAELKLDMAKTPTGAPMPPPVMAPPVANVPGAQPGQPQPPGAVPQQLPADEAARQAEVQRIIEQRRAQMRAEAEKMSQQPQGKQ